MEPLPCTVKITPEKCEVWVGTQPPRLRQAEIATFLGIGPEQVLLYTPAIGGSFGRRGSFSSDWVMEAVQEQHRIVGQSQFTRLLCIFKMPCP
jgi:isoquinoline 1-oxidoreductase subunit beta